jgi:V/A-type H+-transporting ATPase subunit D
MEQVSPTRTELLTRKAQIRLAEQGVQLLRGKREALVREFIGGIRSFSAERNTLRRSLASAFQSLVRALTIDGPEAVASVGLAARRAVDVELEERNIWGTRVVNVKSDYHSSPAGGHRYSAIGTSARIEDATERFESALEQIIKVAPLDRKMRKLADEIRKTTRRVNALEQRLLPALQEEVRYIRAALDQREREDIFRLKRLKNKASRSSSAVQGG